MCLAVPAQIIELLPEQNALVRLDGVEVQVSLALLDQAAIGDYVLVHVGFALSRLDPEEAQATLNLFAEAGLRVAT
jgi:hydrogenase expression/formation protein HypC